MKETIEDVNEMDENTEVEVSQEEADKFDAVMLKFFKAETNIGYELGFRSWKLVKKKIADFKDKTKLEEKICLKLQIDVLNGQAKKPDGSSIDIEWSIISRALRSAWDPYCRNGDILKKIFSFKQRGEGANRKYFISVARDKGTSAKQEATPSQGPEAYA